MGIYDREWYQQPARRIVRGQTPVVIILIIVNVACYLFQHVAQGSMGWVPAGDLGLHPRDVVGRFAVWQLFTSMFLHAGTWHLLFNMLVLYMFGQYVEQRLGRAGFLRFYFGAGIASAIAYVVVGLLTGGRVGAVGASGAIMGVVIYFALCRPNAIVYFLFVIPMRMKIAAAIIVGADLFFFALQPAGGTGVAHIAHLGGALYGFLHFRFAHRVGTLLIRRRSRAEGQAGARRRKDLVDMEKVVDRLLAKISKSGIASLTEAEKRSLQDASERLRRRE